MDRVYSGGVVQTSGAGKLRCAGRWEQRPQLILPTPLAYKTSNGPGSATSPSASWNPALCSCQPVRPPPIMCAFPPHSNNVADRAATPETRFLGLV